jgi:uncharacterized protein (DUF1330 family)
MSAYIIFTREKTLDQGELAIYGLKVPATITDHPIKILAAYGGYEVLEGADTEGVVIVEFPSVEAAKAWYNSQSYREVRKHRFKGAEYRVIVVEGMPPVAPARS